jgi:1-aminocyclopropane-1-carboxylate deaminase/D-cysteine desulfhydrase-like pyridoxal-dependent ACC family enzyme
MTLFPPKETETLPTPIERHGSIFLKRDDLFSFAGVQGGKVRTCAALAAGARGLVTAGSRQSPQCNIVASIARELGIPCEVHTPQGELGTEVQAARDKGAEVIQHRAGYNNVIIARARESARVKGWREIPFGMECDEAVSQTASQIFPMQSDIRRIVVPVGSGMSLAGILSGMEAQGVTRRVLGVVVGADPRKRLDKYAPDNWREMCELIPAGVDYHKRIEADIDGIKLDPIYEAKCERFLNAGDMLWIVGRREIL